MNQQKRPARSSGVGASLVRSLGARLQLTKKAMRPLVFPGIRQADFSVFNAKITSISE
jgi:hypothetical protein